MKRKKAKSDDRPHFTEDTSSDFAFSFKKLINATIQNGYITNTPINNNPSTGLGKSAGRVTGNH